MDGFAWVLIRQTCRPRNCRKLLAGEIYYLPTNITDRLVTIGWAEIAMSPAPDDLVETPARKAPQPAPASIEYLVE